MQKQITVPGLGLVQISKKSNARRLKIRIHPEKGILVTIPWHTSFKKGEKFVLENIDWIKDKNHKIDLNSTITQFNPESEFITRSFNTIFEVDSRIELNAKIDMEQILFLYNPLKIDFEKTEVQDFIKKVIINGLKKEAKLYLPKRVDLLSTKHKLYPTKLTIGSASTRWGTCNTKNEIRLSCRLLLLPDHLIDYVITHELCHIVHKNHGDEFHQLLNSLTNGHSAALNKELRTHSIHIKPGNYKFK